MKYVKSCFVCSYIHNEELSRFRFFASKIQKIRTNSNCHKGSHRTDVTNEMKFGTNVRMNILYFCITFWIAFFLIRKFIMGIIIFFLMQSNQKTTNIFDWCTEIYKSFPFLSINQYHFNLISRLSPTFCHFVTKARFRRGIFCYLFLTCLLSFQFEASSVRPIFCLLASHGTFSEEI